MNQSRATYWLLSAVTKARKASAQVRAMVAKAIEKFRELCGDRFTADDHLLLVVDPCAPRDNLRDRVPFNAKTLATRCRKYLKMGAIEVQRETERKRRHDELSMTYAHRLYVACPVKPTRQSPCNAFESGRNTLPGMEAFE